ncbi:mothers against decapentaplegic homolog 6-like [Apostichopus japonicus]|uniref:mothers against decapentaplegic homolog 6-like n=1 Tax=Stichopus japonicus TaxID=307972 RepID=UPI003AB51F83
MFRSKRSALVRRLWRCSRVVATPADQNADSKNRSEESELEKDFKATAQSFLKRLKESQLEQLVEAVESRGGDHTDCVLFPQGEIRLGRRTVDPHVLCCQLFRWPDVKHVGELKKLYFNCKSSRASGDETNSGHVCCNPYHLSRLCRPESPPPPYSRYPVKRPQDEETHKAGLSSASHTSMLDKRDWTNESTETGNTPTELQEPYAPHSDAEEDELHRRRHWCNVAYWENRTRVGRMYTVFNDHVNIFLELPHGNGFCLGLLHRENRSEPVVRTRMKIGCGLTLSLESDGVWAYNRSNYALFVNSLTLNWPPSRTFRVCRIEPGFSLKIYDFAKSKLLELDKREPQPPDGPINTRSIQISFIKGWGPRYSRQFITSCPCWLEVILSPPR